MAIVWWNHEAAIASKKEEWRIAIEQCGAAVTTARDHAPWLPSFDPDDINDVGTDPDGSTAAVLRGVTLLVNNLENFLPSVVNFSRQYTIHNTDIDASDVARLLDISVDHIEPASEALSKAARRAADGEPRDGVRVDFESIQRVFHEQAEALQKWKAKHRQDIETKLAEKNPAKLASASDAIMNIATLLGK
jgi:hypothetical protein